MTQFRFYLSIRLERWMKTTENLSQDCWNPSTGLNQVPPQHKSQVLLPYDHVNFMYVMNVMNVMYTTPDSAVLVFVQSWGALHVAIVVLTGSPQLLLTHWHSFLSRNHRNDVS